MSLKLDRDEVSANDRENEASGRRPCVWITKETDATSPDLFGLCATRQGIDEIRILAGDPHELADAYLVRLSDACVDTHELAVVDGDAELFESFQLSAAAISVEFRGRVRKVRF